MIYTCSQCAHQSEEDVAHTRKGSIQPGVERWCYGSKCKKTTFHYAALSGAGGLLPAFTNDDNRAGRTPRKSKS